MKQYIYKLFYSEEPNVFYIGKSKNINERFTAHKTPFSLKKSTVKNNWIKSRNIRGWVLQYKIIDMCSTEERVNELEKYYIRLYKDLSFITLKNSTDGGEGTTGHNHTEETRKKMSEMAKGRKHSDETKLKMSKPRSYEARQKIADSKKGKPCPDSTREKNSKPFIIVSPTGEVIKGSNLRKFCKENSLNNGNVTSVLNGKARHCKGWTAPLTGGNMSG